MDRRAFMKTAGTLCVGLGIGGARDALAQNADILPPPALPGGKTLEEALRARQSIRSYADKDIPAEVLSGLLWAACGVNRKESGKRTAPSAVNKQEIDVWVVKKDGFFLYEPKDHMLSRKGSEDIRALTGTCWPKMRTTRAPSTRRRPSVPAAWKPAIRMVHSLRGRFSRRWYLIRPASHMPLAEMMTAPLRTSLSARDSLALPTNSTCT